MDCPGTFGDSSTKANLSPSYAVVRPCVGLMYLLRVLASRQSRAVGKGRLPKQFNQTLACGTVSIMRIRLSDQDRITLFSALSERRVDVAKLTGMSRRIVSDWRRGKYTVPAQQFDTMLSAAGLSEDLLAFEKLSDWWQNKEAGKKGAAARMNLYGPLGTGEGRRKGGLHSYLARSRVAGDIFTPKAVAKPVPDELLAEFIGILIGDGGVTKYQVVISTNAIDDYEYAVFVKQLIEELFKITPVLSIVKNTRCLNVKVSSVELVRFLGLHGIYQGDKLKQGLNIPNWILENLELAKACLRGIFDTDGCIFQERHTIKAKLYCYPRLSFVSMSPYLRDTIYETLLALDMRPRLRNNRSVNLESRKDIDKYFEVIGTSNPKHLKRYIRFGGVG